MSNFKCFIDEVFFVYPHKIKDVKMQCDHYIMRLTQHVVSSD